MIRARSWRVQHIEGFDEIGHRLVKAYVCCNPRHGSACCNFISGGGGLENTDFRTN